uniref:Variant surface glycoprotein 1125.280 n=1 Tax=Trypanosoma brucei TaxID=5691 RepID=A0A1J0R5K5_9TRYP|nr:variant surface glycoprotein 1125.280 [Trypanosoma brucei]
MARHTRKALYPVALIYLASCFVPKSRADDYSDETNKITDICKEHEYLTQLASALSSQLSPEKQALTSLQGLQKKWRLHAAAATKHRDRCLLVALEAEASARIERGKRAIEQAQPIQTAAGAAIQKQLGILEAALHTTTLKVTDDTTSRNDPNNANQADIYFSIVAGAAKPCELRKPDADDPFKNNPLKANKITTLKLTTLSKMKDNLKESKLAISSATSGCPTGSTGKTSTSARLNGCNIGGGATYEWTTAPAIATGSQEPTAIFQENERTTDCGTLHTELKLQAGHHAQLAAALCTALKIQSPTVTSFDGATGVTLAKSSTIRQALRNCDPQFTTISNPADDTEAKALVDYITKAYGEASDAFASKYVTNLENEEIQTRETKTVEGKKVNQLKSSEAVASALSHLEGLRIKRELEAEKKNIPAAVDTKKVEDCKGEKDETKCNNKNGCEFKDGKCKVKDSVKAENDAKTTNTTGRNSFVIYKAPLLLAVLFQG